jgi:hypothetical protein
VATNQLTKFDKDRLYSRASSLWLEMRNATINDTWAKVGIEDTVRRIISMNCKVHGFDEKALKNMPDVAQAQVKAVQVTAKNIGTMSTPLRRPMKVPSILIIANARSESMRHNSAVNQTATSDGVVTDMPLLLPDPAGEMIGPAYQLLIEAMREQTRMQHDQARFTFNVKKALGATKSLVLLCSILPVVKLLLSPTQEAELPLDLTKARGDAHKVAGAVDMGEMIQLSMKLQAYMARRVVKKEG